MSQWVLFQRRVPEMVSRSTRTGWAPSYRHRHYSGDARFTRAEASRAIKKTRRMSEISGALRRLRIAQPDAIKAPACAYQSRYATRHSLLPRTPFPQQSRRFAALFRGRNPDLCPFRKRPFRTHFNRDVVALTRPLTNDRRDATRAA